MQPDIAHPCCDQLTAVKTLKLTSDAKNSSSYYRQGRQLLLTFLAMVTRWSRSTSNFYALIGQNLTMQKINAASQETCLWIAEAHRVLCRHLVMFQTVFFHWIYKMKYSCYIKILLLSMAGLFIGFLVEKCATCQSHRKSLKVRTGWP